MSKERYLEQECDNIVEIQRLERQLGEAKSLIEDCFCYIEDIRIASELNVRFKELKGQGHE